MQFRLSLLLRRLTAICLLACLFIAGQYRFASAVELLGLYEFENDFTDSGPYGNDAIVTTNVEIALNLGYEGNAAAFPSFAIKDPGLRVLDAGDHPNGANGSVGGWVKSHPSQGAGISIGGPFSYARGVGPINGKWNLGYFVGNSTSDLSVSENWQFVIMTWGDGVAQLFVDSDTPVATAVERRLRLHEWLISARPSFWTVPNAMKKPLLDNLFAFGDVLTNEQIALIRRNGVDGILQVAGLIDPPDQLAISGGGETYRQNFDAMETRAGSGVIPNGWTDEQEMTFVRGLGLQEGPLSEGVNPPTNVLNLGGTADAFDTTFGDFIATWDEDYDDNGVMEATDAIANGAPDRALGVGRAGGSSPLLIVTLEIEDKPLRAFVLDWDLEVWGGDPESDFRGSAGGGFLAEANVGGQLYYSDTQSFFPGERFYTFLDRAGTQFDPTLINGNEHSVRGITSGIVEVAAGDGAVGNMVRLSFDANTGADGDGWISAVDNVRLRALAPGDVDGNGSVDPTDIVELLKGGQFGKGVNGVTWQQGDFNGDDKFDPLDLVEVLTFLSGQFPASYASEVGTNSDVIPDGHVIVVPEPSTWILLTVGGLFLVGWRARSEATQRRQAVNCARDEQTVGWSGRNRLRRRSRKMLLG